ncbi:hypothetical protein ACJMK2_013111 [Sinanodonta woodiana]|uniref:CCZ1/INTU/HSP4 first Longin domain-containing protein n=1 Tax=Sinanodonta woodiana TaxID=1069815 RepID=A0ABD3VBW9_SINWO
MANKCRRRDRIFFVYDHSMLKKEEDDPKSAILFFTPDSVSDDTQCSIVGHLMGMMEFLSSTVSISHPRAIKLETDKYIIKRVNRYSLVLQGFHNESNMHLTNQLEHLYKCFVTFHGSIDSLSLRFKARRAAFLEEFKSIWTEILDLGGFDQNLLTQAFNYLPYVDVPKNASHLFLQASHILQSSQRRPYVLAGMILYKNGVVCSQLTPELTKLLILAQSQLPCFLLHTDFEMPIGCKLMSVYLTDDDYFSVHPLHHDAKRHYKVAEFSKHRESVVIKKDKTQSRTEKFPKRSQPYPQNGDSNSLGQGHSRISLSRKEISSWSDRRQITSIVGVPLVECKSGEMKAEEEIGVMHGFSADKDRDGKHWSPNNKDNKKSKIQSDTRSEPCREKDRNDLFEKNKESQKRNTQNREHAERAKFEVGDSTEDETVSELENGDIDKTHEKRSQEVEGNTSGTNKLHNINLDESELETLDIEKYSIEVNLDSDGFVCGTDKHLPDHDSVVYTDVPRVEDEIPPSENQQGNTKCTEETTVTQLEATSASLLEDISASLLEDISASPLEDISASLLEENKIPTSENEQGNTKCNEETTVTQLEAISASLLEENKIPTSENQQGSTKCNEPTTTVTQLEATSASLLEEKKIPTSENQQGNTKHTEETTVTQLEATSACHLEDISASLLEENKIPTSENQQGNTKCTEATTVTQLEATSASLLEENKIPTSENQQGNTKRNEETTVTQLEATSASHLEDISASLLEENKIPTSENQQGNTKCTEATTVTQLEATSASRLEENKIPTSENQQGNTKCTEATTITQLEATSASRLEDISASLLEENKIPTSENQQGNTKRTEETTVTQLEATSVSPIEDISASLLEENKIPSSENQQGNTKYNEPTTTVTQLEATSASLLEEKKIPTSENQQGNTKRTEETTVTQLEATSASLLEDISASLLEENKIPTSENQQGNTKCTEATTVTQLEATSASLLEENKIPTSENQQGNTKRNEPTTVTQLEATSASLLEENKIPTSENQQGNTKHTEETTVTQLEATSVSPIEENKIPPSENQQDNTKCTEETTVTQLEATSSSLLEENKIPTSKNQQDNTKCTEQGTYVTRLEAILTSTIDENGSDKQHVFETEKEQISSPVKDDISVKEQEHLHNSKCSMTEACNNETDFHERDSHETDFHERDSHETDFQCHAEDRSKVLAETETLVVTTESGNTDKARNEVSVNVLENYKTESDKQTVRNSLLLISNIARSGLHLIEEKENIDPELKDASEAQMVGKPVAEKTNYGLIGNLSKKSSSSFSSSDDMPSSTQFGQEQFKFQSHSSGSNTEVMTSEEVKDIMTSFVSHDNKAKKRNTVQRELDDSVKYNSQKGMTSFSGSFSSDQSSDSTLSKVWTPDMDGLNDLTLYVQRHSDISLLLLLENPVQNEEAVLHMLWKSAVPPIADLDFYIKECLEQSADKQSFLDQYNYLKYEGFSHQLKGNSLDILENSELPFQQLTSNIHEEFLGSQYMYDVLLRTQTYACHGHRTPVAEHYFQLNVAPRLTSGLPVPNDPVFCLDLLARKKMANNSNAIL